MNSFTGWIGGKKLLRNTIIEQFPEQKAYDRYIEVFGGAGWVLFAKDSHARLEVYNDVNSDLVNLYRCVKYHCGELQRELDCLPISREVFFDNVSQLATSGLTDIQRAARYFYIVKVSFGTNRRTFGTDRKNLSNAIEYLTEIKERLKNVVIENKIFESLIKTYDRPTALFYLDPPYYGTEKLYADVFTENQHYELCEILKGIKGKFVLSYNDCEFTRELYKDFNILEVSRSNSLTAKSGKAKRYKEIIVKNY